MRSRNIKPGFFKNADLADAGPHAQLLFAGLWGMADKRGRLKDEPRKIKAEIFPYYECDVNELLTVIARLGFIHRYRIDNGEYIVVAKFRKHQSPHHTERESDLPEPPPFESVDYLAPSESTEKSRLSTGDSPLEHGGNPSDSGLLTPDSLIPDPLPPDSVLATASPVAEAQGAKRGGGIEIDGPRVETPMRNGSANGSGHAHTVGDLLSSGAAPPLIERAAMAADLEQVLHLLEEHRSNLQQRAQVSVDALPRLLGKYTLDQQRRMLVAAIELDHPDLSRASLGGEEPGGSAHAQH